MAETVTVSWYELGVPGGDTLYFNVLRTDSTLGGLSTERETAQREFRANAFFISYSGRLTGVCAFGRFSEDVGGNGVLWPDACGGGRRIS